MTSTVNDASQFLPVWRHLLPIYWVVNLYTREGRFGSRMASTVEGAIRKAASVRVVGIVACSLPFQGGWSPQGIPDVSMPPGWNEFFPHGAHDD